MTLTWSARRDVDGILSIILENDLLRVVVIPELGGRIWSVAAKPRDREMLWHHPTLVPRPVAPGASYDDVFCGGWDELFPSDSPVSIDGFDMPDHGEWWSIPWQWQVEPGPDELTLTLEASGFATPHEARRTMTLREGAATIALGTRIRNTGSCPIPYLWRHHPALPLKPGARVDLPEARVIVDRELTPRFGEDEFIWPRVRLVDGQIVELRALPAEDSRQSWMLYATDLPTGWCAVTYPEEGIGINFAFDAGAIDTITIFASFGGWRNLATILPEPGVGYPSDLGLARAVGRHGTLLPGATVEYKVMAKVSVG